MAAVGSGTLPSNMSPVDESAAEPEVSVPALVKSLPAASPSCGTAVKTLSTSRKLGHKIEKEEKLYKKQNRNETKQNPHRKGREGVFLEQVQVEARVTLRLGEGHKRGFPPLPLEQALSQFGECKHTRWGTGNANRHFFVCSFVWLSPAITASF